MNDPAFERADLVAHGVGRSQDLKDPGIEAPLIRARRHLHDQNGSLGDALALIIANSDVVVPSSPGSSILPMPLSPYSSMQGMRAQVG